MDLMSRRRSLLLAAGVVAFATITTFVGSASGAPARFLVLDLVTGLTFVVAGLAATWLRPSSPAGPALLVSGALWYVGSYAPTGQPVVTHLGFAFEGYYDLVLAALLLVLSSPARRLHPRWLIAALAAAMAVRSLGRLLLQDPVRLFPDCGGCPPNPFALCPTLPRSKPSRSPATWLWRGLPRSWGSLRSVGCCAPDPSGAASAGRFSVPVDWQWPAPPTTRSSTPGRPPPAALS
jgi:hypothetical protein